MAKFIFKVKFPCGLEIQSCVSSIWLGEATSFEDVKFCPLHGKNCGLKGGRK